MQTQYPRDVMVLLIHFNCRCNSEVVRSGESSISVETMRQRSEFVCAKQLYVFSPTMKFAISVFLQVKQVLDSCVFNPRAFIMMRFFFFQHQFNQFNIFQSNIPPKRYTSSNLTSITLLAKRTTDLITQKNLLGFRKTSMGFRGRSILKHLWKVKIETHCPHLNWKTFTCIGCWNKNQKRDR